MNTVKFYVGEMSSHWNDRKEVHVLDRLDFVLSANNERGIAFLDTLLREAQRDFIRSDNEYRTLFEGDVCPECECTRYEDVPDLEEAEDGAA